ncbi:hypothetical protein ACC786_30580 [Rhizobium ruizarguesonis]
MDRLPSPSQLMGIRRPERYSDSERVDAYRLSESELRNHLDTLTDRNQHKDFENFCRKLCERELAPNLRPQTGPEGGGDGKVDTETYPVARDIAERWYAAPGDSADEYWAFAFSSKKSWSSKVRSDVAGIIGEKRGYQRIICVTSRPARQVTRLKVQQELLKKSGVKVDILDREWIIDRVFSHGHKDIAFEHLHAGEFDPTQIKVGPTIFAATRLSTSSKTVWPSWDLKLTILSNSCPILYRLLFFRGNSRDPGSRRTGVSREPSGWLENTEPTITCSGPCTRRLGLTSGGSTTSRR